MPIPSLPEHKIGVFVLFWPSGPPFSGILSTKTAFLCQKRRYFPGFGSFRAQNRHFCALLSASFFPMAPPASNKPHLAEKYSSLTSILAHLGRTWLLPGQGAAAGWQMMLPDCAARKNLPLCWRDCCSAGDRGTEEAELRWRLWADAAAKTPLRKEHHREARRAVLVSACWQRRGKAPSGGRKAPPSGSRKILMRGGG